MDTEYWYANDANVNENNQRRSLYKIDQVNFSSIKSRINYFSQQRQHEQQQQQQQQQQHQQQQQRNSLKLQHHEPHREFKKENSFPHNSKLVNLNNGYYNNEGEEEYLNTNNRQQPHQPLFKRKLSTATLTKTPTDSYDSDSRSSGGKNLSNNSNRFDRNSATNIRTSKKVNQILRKFSTDLSNSTDELGAPPISASLATLKNSNKELDAMMTMMTTSTPGPRRYMQRTYSINDYQRQQQQQEQPVRQLSNSYRILNHSQQSIISERPSLTNINDDEIIASFQTPSYRYSLKSQINNQRRNRNDNNNNKSVLEDSHASSTQQQQQQQQQLTKTSSLISLKPKNDSQQQQQQQHTINLIVKIETSTNEQKQQQQQSTNSSSSILSTSLISLPTIDNNNNNSLVINNSRNNNYDRSKSKSKSINNVAAAAAASSTSTARNSLLLEITNEEDFDRLSNQSTNSINKNNHLKEKEEEEEASMNYESEETLINKLFYPILSSLDNYDEATTIAKEADKELVVEEKEEQLKSDYKLDKTYSLSTPSIMSLLLDNNNNENKIHNYSTDGSIRTHSSLIDVAAAAANNDVAATETAYMTDNDAQSLTNIIQNNSESSILMQNSSSALFDNDEEEDCVKIVEGEKKVEQPVLNSSSSAATPKITLSKKSRNNSILLDRILLNDVKKLGHSSSERYYVPSEQASIASNKQNDSKQNSYNSKNYRSKSEQHRGVAQHRSNNFMQIHIPDISEQLGDGNNGQNNPNRDNARRLRIPNYNQYNSNLLNSKQQYAYMNDKDSNFSYTVPGSTNYLPTNGVAPNLDATKIKSEKKSKHKFHFIGGKDTEDKTSSNNSSAKHAILNLKRFSTRKEKQPEDEIEKELRRAQESHKIRNQLKKNCKIS